MQPPAADDDATLAIVAHSLLASMTVIRSGLATIVHRGDKLDPEQSTEILTRALEQSRFVSDILADLVRGLPPDAETLLRPRGRPVPS